MPPPPFTHRRRLLGSSLLYLNQQYPQPTPSIVPRSDGNHATSEIGDGGILKECARTKRKEAGRGGETMSRRGREGTSPSRDGVNHDPSSWPFCTAGSGRGTDGNGIRFSLAAAFFAIHPWRQKSQGRRCLLAKLPSWNKCHNVKVECPSLARTSDWRKKPPPRVNSRRSEIVSRFPAAADFLVILVSCWWFRFGRGDFSRALD